MNEMKATLTVQEWDYIMNLISERPYKEVFGLVSKMMGQFQAQRAPATPEVQENAESK